MGGTPLIAHVTPQAAVAYRGNQKIGAGQFLSHVTHVASQLPPGAPVLNACSDRYYFTVGLAAALVAGVRCLLPPTHTPEVIRNLRQIAPDAICLTDDHHCAIALPRMRIPVRPPADVETWPPPLIPANQEVADIFTSGSTGVPVPHRKTWGRLTQCVHIEARRLGLSVALPRTLLATIAPQHSYGLETSVLLPLLSGSALSAERPFFPADICASLVAAPGPRVLVSTPVHLRALLGSHLTFPPVEFIVSATAPITQEFARAVEKRFGAPLLEIYGSTETGQIANRRPAHSVEWQLWDQVHLSRRGDRVWAEGGHIEVPTPLGDNVEILGSNLFVLGGRLHDVVNIAGKRSSIDYLNHQLLAIPGVQDGTFFLPTDQESSNAGIVRLSAVVVAPTLDSATLLRHLRASIDPAFLPRPLIMVDSLPRNSTGKLPLEELRSIFATKPESLV